VLRTGSLQRRVRRLVRQSGSAKIVSGHKPLTQANSDQTVLIMSKFTWQITSLVEEPLKLVERVGSNFLQVAGL
jgi:hypothetical protein